MNIENFPKIVYYGTISIHKESLKHGINLERGDSCVDFGKGFYVTTNYYQAVRFAERLSRLNNSFQTKMVFENPKYSNPMVVCYGIDKNRLFNLNGYFFEQPDDK